MKKQENMHMQIYHNTGTHACTPHKCTNEHACAYTNMESSPCLHTPLKCINEYTCTYISTENSPCLHTSVQMNMHGHTPARSVVAHVCTHYKCTNEHACAYSSMERTQVIEENNNLIRCKLPMENFKSESPNSPSQNSLR